ncbi:hypothetical protein WME90_25385 [Sorangium sp. So ce375]|uniref:hypothetical protein n=1 Tax=Sorangium sp. So ce375 TaxID=3133306 RepID=UPI003F5AF684
MTDDDLLKALARVAREQDRASDPRWSARALGTLTAGERDALEAEAQRSPEDREAWEASRPLDGEARSRITDRILAGLPASAGERGAETAGAGTAGAAAAAGAEMAGAAAAGAETAGPPASGQRTTATRGGQVIPLPRKPGRARWLIAAAAVAAAAAALLVVRLSAERGNGTPRGLLDDPGALAMLPVPAYAMTLAGGEVSERSAGSHADTPATARLGPGSRLEIALRPSTRVDGPIAVRAFLIQGEAARPWDVQADVSDQGAARIEGDTETLFRGVPEGEWEIAIAIGRPAALPDGAAGVVDARPHDGKDSTFRVLRFKVLLLPRAAPRPNPTAGPATPSKGP